MSSLVSSSGIVTPRALLTAALLAASIHCVQAESSNDVIGVLSSRPDVVSGNDALVWLNPPAEAGWSALLNGQDVSAFFRRSESGKLLGLLSGLKVGKNVLEVRAAEKARSRIDLVNHPLSGPIFSGPHQQPFICQTEPNGLGPPLDADCSAKTIFQYYYKSTQPVALDPSLPAPPAPNLALGFKTYDPSAPQPSDVAQTVTTDGHTVPYIVVREVGTINRAVYDIEFLYQPNQSMPTPWTRPAGAWNGRLIYVFGGGCGPGYRQGTLSGALGPAYGPFLSRGYAVATSTLNIAGNNCDDHLSAETLSMVKEHFIKEYGAPVHTIGWGESGGAIHQLMTAQNYPGLLDGLLIDLSFPDSVGSAQTPSDCALILRAIAGSKQPWTGPQKSAVVGFATWRTCTDGWSDQAGRPWGIIDPVRFCPSLLPKESIYDHRFNPKGVRCDIYDNEINIFGRDPRTGFAYRPLDNVGIQYGLVAFNRGQIDAEQFVELNEQVGGFDDDGNIMASRSVAEPRSVRIAYQRGLVLTGGGGLAEVPIIDWRRYGDDMADSHDRFRSFAIRARLIAANGNADNQVIFVYPRYQAVGLSQWSNAERNLDLAQQTRDLVQKMDRWLDRIAADHDAGTTATKVARDKPSDIADGCWTTDADLIVERATYGGANRCNQEYPVHSDPRIAAGGPLADDILKCALKPIKVSDYAKPLTAAQLERLKAVFPSGVCDYGSPAVGKLVTTAIWERY
jgi:hypothetical protein